MSTLHELLAVGEKRRKVVADACVVLDQEVADKRGLGGMAIKTAFKVVKGIQPGFIEDVVDGLLDDFLDTLDPLYQQALEKNLPPGPYISQSSDDMAERLLSITDARATRASRPVVKSTYSKLRPSAKKHVVAAAPRIGSLLTDQLADA